MSNRSDHIKLPMPAAADLAAYFHETYESLAPMLGYETNYASRKPWGKVPERNRILMQAVCLRVIDYMTKYLQASLAIGDVLHKEAIPFHAIGDLVDHFRAGLTPNDLGPRLYVVLEWLELMGYRPAIEWRRVPGNYPSVAPNFDQRPDGS